jgi:hypothetical protein
MVNISHHLYNITESATATMPRELPPIPFGDVAAYKRAREGSGLSDDELLEKQAGMERRIAKKAAKRGVTLIGAAVVRQRNVAAAAAAAAASLRERAAAASAAATASAADAGGVVVREAAVSAAADVSSRGRPLIARKKWSEDDD